MKLLKIGEKLYYLNEKYEVLGVVISTDNHVFYEIDYKKDGDTWYIFAGILDEGNVRALPGVWCE